MSQYHIKPHNFRRYNAAFYDDECVECLAVISEGDPIGFLEPGRYGPLCDDCLNQLKEPLEVTKDGKDNAPPLPN